MKPGEAAGHAAQLVECLLNMRRVLGWIPSTTENEWVLRRRRRQKE